MPYERNPINHGAFWIPTQVWVLIALAMEKNKSLTVDQLLILGMGLSTFTRIVL